MIDKNVLACCALHNFVLKHRRLAFSTGTDAYVKDGSWRGLPRSGLGLGIYRALRPHRRGKKGRQISLAM